MEYTTFNQAKKAILSASSYLGMHFNFRSMNVFRMALDAVDAAKLEMLEDTEAELFRVMQMHLRKADEYFCILESAAKEIYPARTLSKETKVTINSRTHRVDEFMDDPLGVNALISRKLYLDSEKEPLTAEAHFGWIEGERRKLVYRLGKEEDLSYVDSRDDLSLDYFRRVSSKPLPKPERISLEEKIKTQLRECTQSPTPSS